MSIVEIKNASAKIEGITKKLDAVLALFKENPIAITGEFVELGGVKLQTIFDTHLFTITVAYYPEAGKNLPPHAHKTSIEYLICTRGRFILKLPESTTRILCQGECASIPPGMEHTTISLENGSELLAICVPPEEAYRRFSDGDN